MMGYLHRLAADAAEHPCRIWCLAAFCLGLLFFHQHLALHLEQESDYYYLTTKTTFNTDTALYANFTRSVMRTPGFPSDTTLFEHRGETTLAFMTYALPCWFMSILSMAMGGNLDLGYQLAGFLAIFLSALLLYPFLSRLATNWPAALFFLCTIFCFSTFLRPQLLEHPEYFGAWLAQSGSTPYFFNEFHTAHNIQVSFLTYAWFLGALVLLLLGEKAGFLVVLNAGASLAGLVYTYLYYAPQGALIYLIFLLWSAARRDWVRVKRLLWAGTVALVLVIPILIQALTLLGTPLMRDMTSRFGMVEGSDFTSLAWRLLACAALYSGVKLATRSFTYAAGVLAANVAAVSLILMASGLLDLDLQTGHLVSRACYPVMGLVLADLLYSVLFLVPAWRLRLQLLASVVVLLLAAGMFAFQIREVRGYINRTIGYNTLEADTAELLAWMVANKKQDDVFLTLDSELVRLMPAHAGAWSFVALGNSSAASNDELMHRFVLACHLIGMSRTELSRRLERELPWWILASEMSERERGKYLDLDSYPEALWTYTFFGRSYWIGTLEQMHRLGPEDREILRRRKLRPNDDYFPVAERREILARFDDVAGTALEDCPYRVTHVIQSEYDRQGADLQNSALFPYLVKERDFGRYAVYRLRRQR